MTWVVVHDIDFCSLVRVVKSLPCHTLLFLLGSFYIIGSLYSSILVFSGFLCLSLALSLVFWKFLQPQNASMFSVFVIK
jgi:hypothetical protein